MADIAQLERALINADKAGDSEAAMALAGEIRRMRGAGVPAKEQKPSFDPTEGMSTMDKALAGAGKAFVDVGRGVGQLFGLVDEKDIEEARRRDAPLMKTGAGMAGNLVGNVAVAAPTAFIPGVNTVTGGAAVGAAMGALQPTGEGESRLANATVGGIAGGVVPAAIRGGKAVKAALIDPFTEAGRTRIAGGVINRVANDPKAVARALEQGRGATPGFNPTAGQIADDAGVASLERTVRAINPAPFGEVEAAQRQALADAVRGVAGDPARRAAAVAARDSAVAPLYDAAKSAVVQGDDTLNALMKRPSMQSGAARAANISAERGDEFMLAQSPAMYPGRALHDLKMGLDDAIGTPGVGGLQGAERVAATGTKADYLAWLESKIPEYGQARTTFADMSKPINQMDIGQEFANRLIPSLYRDMPSPQQLNAAAFARALADNGDDIARNVTGMKGATLEGVMAPEQMSALRGVASDLQRMKVGELAGRGVGSDTVQKASMSHIAAEAGIPNWMSDVARVPGGMLKSVGSALYGNSDRQVQQMLAEMLRNPQEAAKAMQAAGVNPSVMAEMLKRGAQQGALTSIPAMLND